MSHFTKLDKANVVDAEAFIAAAAELGLTVVERNVEMRAWDTDDAPVHVDICCRFPGKKGDGAAKYGIGLIKNGKQYEMVSDWALTGFYLPKNIQAKLPTGFPQKDGPGGGAYAACEAFRGLTLQLTSKHTLIANYRRQGFVARAVEDANKNIQLTLTRG